MEDQQHWLVNENERLTTKVLELAEQVDRLKAEIKDINQSHKEYVENLRDEYRRQLDACWDTAQEKGYEQGRRDEKYK